jgi:hypothetical protein
MVHCSLALHHFSNADAVALLRHCAQISTRWVLISDLVRSSFTTASIWLLTQFIYRDAMTRNDARVSAQRAFTFEEMAAFAVEAAWTGHGHARFPFARQALWLDSGADVPQEALQAEPCPC